MKPQFIWDKTGKPLQTSESYEGAKDFARLIFVGLAEMHGFDQADTMRHLDMSYDSYRNKAQTFRANLREALRRKKDGTFDVFDDQVKRFLIKVTLCLNAIKWNHGIRKYLNLNDYAGES